MKLAFVGRTLVVALLLTAFSSCTTHVADNDGHVIVGPYPAPNDMSTLKSHGVTRIVSLLDPSQPYEDTLLRREEAYAKQYGLAFTNYAMPRDSASDTTYRISAEAAATSISADNGKVFLHSYLTSTRTQTVEALLKQKGITLATYILPRRAGSSFTYALDSAEAAYQASHFQEVVDLLGHRQDLDRRGQLLLAWAIYHLDRTDEAEEHFRQILREHPDENEARIGVAYCRYRKHDLRTADSLFAVAIDKHPKDPSANAGMGLTRYEEGKYDDARKYLDVSLHTDSINVEAGEVRLKLDSVERQQSLARTTSSR